MKTIPKGTRWMPLLALMSFMLLVACQPGGPPELRQAAEVVHELLQPRNLSRSAFTVAYSSAKPSQFVSYFFSDMGTAEWPPSEAMVDEFEREQMKAAGITMLPEGVAFVPLSPDPEVGKQLVVTYDDERGVVIVEGYVDPAAAPVLIREWKVPQVEPAPGVEEIYRANIDMGISDRSFEVPSDS